MWVRLARASPLGLLIGLTVGFGLAFNLTTPLFEAPDEENHFLFIRYLQIYHALPVQGLDPAGPRAHHPPLYYLLGALLTSGVPQAGSADRIAMRVNPHVTFRYGDAQVANKALYVHATPAERWPYADQALAVHLARLLSTAFAALAVAATYGLGRELRPDEPACAVLAAGLVGLNGGVLFMAGVVQNATAALAASAVCLYTLSRGLRRGFTFRRWLAVGAAYGFGLLVQTSLLALAAPLALAGLFDLWARHGQLRRAFLDIIGGAGLPVAVLDGWWFWRNQQLYGDWTASNTIAALWSHGPLQSFGQTVYNLTTGLAGRYGQGLMVDYPAWMYVLADLIAGLALIGALRAFGRQRRAGRRPPAAELQLWGLHLAAVLAVTAALVVYWLYFIHGLHAQYLFTALPSLALFFAGGLLAWVRPAWRSRWAAGLLAAAALLPAYGLALLSATYAPPPPLTPAARAALTPVDANIGDTARVRGYTLSAAQVHPGDTLIVTVGWEPLSQTDVPYTVFLHVLDPELGSLAQVDIYPGAGNWATTVWDLGRPFVDQYRLTLPADTPAPDQAQLVIGLYNEATGQRLPVTGADAGSPDEAWVRLGALTLTP